MIPVQVEYSHCEAARCGRLRSRITATGYLDDQTEFQDSEQPALLPRIMGMMEKRGVTTFSKPRNVVEAMSQKAVKTGILRDSNSTAEFKSIGRVEE
jgi:hypothetical protein